MTAQETAKDTAQDIAYYYEIGALGSFSTSIMDLFGKADTTNQSKLAKAFPEYMEAYTLWYYKPSNWDGREENENV